jgi:hypothetical protein
MRTHVCQCGFILDREWNAALKILKLALSTTGHVGTWVDASTPFDNAQGKSLSIHPNALPRFAHHARLTPRFANANGRFDLYSSWSNLKRASWVYERRISASLDRRVSSSDATRYAPATQTVTSSGNGNTYSLDSLEVFDCSRNFF